MVGEVEIRLSPPPFPRLPTPCSGSQYFSRGSPHARYLIHTYSVPIYSLVLAASSPDLSDEIKVALRIPRSIRESRVQLAPLGEGAKKEPRANESERAETRRLLFCLASPEISPRENSCARADIMETNRPWVARWFLPSRARRRRRRRSLTSYLISVELTIQGMRAVDDTINGRDETRS